MFFIICYKVSKFKELTGVAPQIPKFKGLEEKEYPFDSYIPLPYNFLEKGLIALMKSKHLGEAKKLLSLNSLS